jgi:NAD-dependent DNA ligase
MAFADYDFAKHQDISPATAKALHKRFTSWEQLAQTPPEQIMDVRGVTDRIALDILDAAKAHIRADKTKRAQGAERILDVSPEGSQRRFILSAKAADFSGPDGAGRVTNIKRRRKLVTPAVCDECGMDFVDKMGLSDYSSLSSGTQDDLRRRVAAHKQMVHPPENKLILTEDELHSLKGDANPKPDRAKAQKKAPPPDEALEDEESEDEG